MKKLFIIMSIMFSTMIVVGQTKKPIRSLVDLRDSTNTKSNVIIINCDCKCDTVPKTKSDTIPVAKIIYFRDEYIEFI